MPVKTLQEFTTALQALIGVPSVLRPFVCEGSPLECDAFIVGFNPATEMDVDFWSYWSEHTGFSKSRWFEDYKLERRNRPLKPGKTRRSEVSNTRRVIDWLSASALPVKCLETNIYSAPSAESSDLGAKDRVSDAFDFLLETVSPRVIVAHGKDAAEHLAGRANTVRILNVSHFSRGWSRERAADLGHEIKIICGQ